MHCAARSTRTYLEYTAVRHRIRNAEIGCEMIASPDTLERLSRVFVSACHSPWPPHTYAFVHMHTGMEAKQCARLASVFAHDLGSPIRTNAIICLYLAVEFGDQFVLKFERKKAFSRR